MSVRAFRLAYDGRPFHGFQRQPDVPTVEGALFDALRDLGVFEGSKPTGYAAAGRTDAGVSALAQTVAFDCPDWCSPAALNGRLPDPVRAWAAADVDDDFHATHGATARAYVYHLYAPTDPDAPAAAGTADDDRAREALAALRGEHDFHNLTPDDRNTVRELSGSLRRDGDFLVVTLRAGGFSRELVRRIVSVVRAVATAAASPERIDRLLDSDPVDGPEGVPPAPPTPLVLTAVDYPGVAFEPDADAVADAREAFGSRWRDGRVAARVAAEVRDGLDTDTEPP